MALFTFSQLNPFIIDNDSNITLIIQNALAIHLRTFLNDLNIHNIKTTKGDNAYAGLTAFTIYDPKELDIIKLYSRLYEN